MEDKLKQGETLFSQGKIEEAEECFLGVLEKDSEDAEALNNLGVIHYTRGDLQRAEDFFLKALAAKDDYRDALLNLANLYQNERNWEKAAGRLEKCILIDDQDPDLFNRLGTIYLEMGDSEKAQIALEKSLELDPGQEIVAESLKLFQERDSASSCLPAPSTFRGAFAEINITPDVSGHNPVLLQGMGGLPRTATAVSAPLMMQLLLLEDDHFTKILVITADLFGFGPEIVDNVRALVAQWGIEPEGLILNASHTHYAPGTVSHASKLIGPFYEDYTKQIVQAIANQLPMLYDRLEECEIDWGKADAQIGVSRRLKKDGKVVFAPNPEGYYDRNTPFILFHMLKTDKKVLLVNHGCHPTGLGSENVISADYPGYMRNALKSNGVVDGVMFLQGGAGSTKESVCINGEVRFCENSTGAKEKGEFLATQIMNELEEDIQPVKGSFFCARRRILLPLKQSTPADVLSQIKDNQETDALVREWANSVLNRYPNGDYPDRLVMEVQLISIGDKVSFITLPAEPVAELARELRRLANNPDGTFVLGYTNGLTGYLPTEIMIEEGGYETEASQFVYLIPSVLNTGAESAIISATEKCISSVPEKERPNGYGRYHLAKKKQKAFFVLSAGRCGTMTLAHLLNTATNARVWHHPRPDPIKESLLAYWGEIDKRKAFWKARYSIIHKTWSDSLVHGETDLLMTPFCDILAGEIPEAKFIVLARDPRDFVRSGMRRNYYHGHPWDIGRLRPQEGSEEFERWNRLDQFGKICWLWKKTYESINQIVNRIGKHRVLTVRFEDLVDGIEKTDEIFDFLDLEGFDENKVRELISRKFNAQTGGSFPKPEHWSEQLKKTLWNSCGPIAEQFGYSRDCKELASASPSSQLEVSPVSTRTSSKQPSVSVGLPVYNGGAMLGEAIESILSQDFDDIELIISDNGSTDSTQKMCCKYQKMDRRIHYYRFEENLGAIKNFLRVLDLSIGPYFMWASSDDLREKSFVRKCLQPLEKDASIALVYPRTKVLDQHSRVLGIAKDNINADQEDPLERFRHLIWEIGMCNLFYGLYRTKIVRKARSFYKSLYRAYDNLFLAEIALLGKITQIEDILFIRRLTRNYDKPLDERNADIISAVDPLKLYEGITLPYCRLAYAHIEILNESNLLQSEKNILFKEILKCFKSRFGSQMMFEIDRAIELINREIFFYTWDKGTMEPSAPGLEMFELVHVNNLLKNLQEAAFIYPELARIKNAHRICLEKMHDHQIEDVRKMAFK
ncbi:MAG: glycosyltransferase [Desulfobacterales bacterium]|nr:glycosyltransferase [Desulfobacterales bacterium]